MVQTTYAHSVAGTIRFGSYELRALLGQGGMARVYRAVRVGPHGFAKEVALKVLDPTATATADQIEQLTDEARLGGMLRHQNIVATDELGQVGPFYYIAMELVDGWPLDLLLREHRRREKLVPVGVVLDLLIEIANALDYVHTLSGPDGSPLRLVHRDMKPANVMISRNGQVKIMDFGIAKATTNVYTTQEESTRGTPLFMSPEQVSGGELDGRSDLFSVGSMLQEMTTLQKTFEGDDLLPILRAVLSVDIERSTERLKKVAPTLLPVFLRCMERDPEDRYPHALALKSDLRQLRSRISGGSIREWVKRLAPALAPSTDGDLGDVLPGVIVVVNDASAGEDTISSPMQPVNEPPSQFEMPLGPSAGPTTGKPTTSEDSVSRLNWQSSAPDGPPEMPTWMKQANFMRSARSPSTDEQRDGFVKPGRPIAPSYAQVSKVSPPPTARSGPKTAPALPPGHPLHRHNLTDQAEHPQTGPVQFSPSRPEARPLSKERPPGATSPKPRTRSFRASARLRPIASTTRPDSHQAGEKLPQSRRLAASAARISLTLGVLAALVYSYSHVPGTVGDIARSIVHALMIVSEALGLGSSAPT